MNIKSNEIKIARIKSKIEEVKTNIAVKTKEIDTLSKKIKSEYGIDNITDAMEEIDEIDKNIEVLSEESKNLLSSAEEILEGL